MDGLQRMDTTSSSAKEIIISIHKDLDFMESEVMNWTRIERIIGSFLNPFICLKIAALHVTVEGYSFQWRRRAKVNKTPLPKLGSTIPPSLIFVRGHC